MGLEKITSRDRKKDWEKDPDSGPRWISVDDRLPAKMDCYTPVLGWGIDVHGTCRVLQVRYIWEYEVEDEYGEFEGNTRTNPQDGLEYWPEGWYEYMHSDSIYRRLNFAIFGWMKMPTPPKKENKLEEIKVGENPPAKSDPQFVSSAWGCKFCFSMFENSSLASAHAIKCSHNPYSKKCNTCMFSKESNTVGTGSPLSCTMYYDDHFIESVLEGEKVCSLYKTQPKLVEKYGLNWSTIEEDLTGGLDED